MREWSGEMDYLIVKLAWFLVAAFALGGVVGWVSCGPARTQARSR
jgi:hypothetical protein